MNSSSYMEVSINGGTPIAGWFLREHPMKMDESGDTTQFRKPPKIGDAERMMTAMIWGWKLTDLPVTLLDDHHFPHENMARFVGFWPRDALKGWRFPLSHSWVSRIESYGDLGIPHFKKSRDFPSMLHGHCMWKIGEW